MFANVVRAEWTKLVSVRTTAIALAAAAGLTVLLTILATTGTEISCEPPPCPVDVEREDTVLLSLTGVYFGMLALAALGVLAITSEYATGTIRTTFTAMPMRLPVLAAKALVSGALALAVGIPAAIASFYVGMEILPGSGFNELNGYPRESLGDGDNMRAVIGTSVFFALLTLLSLGVGTIVRHTAGAITIVLGLAFVPLILTGVLSERAGDLVEKLTPVTAGLAVQHTVAGDAPIGPWAGLGVLAAYTVGTLLVAGWLLVRRDG